MCVQRKAASARAIVFDRRGGVVRGRRVVVSRFFGRSFRGDGVRLVSPPESLIDVKAITLMRREGIDGLRFAGRNFGSRSLFTASLSFALSNLLEFLCARPTSFRFHLQPITLGTLFHHAFARLLRRPLRLFRAGELPFSLQPEALSFATLAVALHLPTLGDGEDDKDDNHECASDEQTPEPQRHAVFLTPGQGFWKPAARKMI
jgi:hypothetical protein